MEVSKKEIKDLKCGDHIHIYFIGDIHEGSANHASKEFKQAIQLIKEDSEKNIVRCIGMGDYIDAITYHDKRFNPTEVDEDYAIKDLKNLANKQFEKLIDKMQPIISLFDCFLMGNHEESITKYDSHTPTDSLKQYGDVLGYTGFYILNLQRNGVHYQYTIALNHGYGGSGFREGYPVNKVHDLFRWIRADVNIMGHLHQMKEDDQEFIEYRAGIKRRKVYYGINGTFMYKEREGTRGYFEGKPGPHSSIGMLMLDIRMGRSFNDTKLKLEKIRF